MRINILLCDTFPGLLPDYIPSYTSMFEKLFTSVSQEVELSEYRVLDGVFPTTIDPDAIYLITGCNKASYDNDDWIVKLRHWVVDAMEKHAKLVGICFGHQVIAMALGGKTERYADGWGTGIRSSQIIDEDMKSHFGSDDIRLLYNHHDQVVQLPSGATPLASSSFCQFEGFRIGDKVLTFQGHPEYTPEYAIHLLENHADGEDPEVCRKALESIGLWQHQGGKAAEFILKTLTK